MPLGGHGRQVTGRGSFPNRRIQRCLSFALIIILLVVFGVRYQLPSSKMTQLQLDTLNKLHVYGSSPEAGMPPLPFKDNSVRRSTEEPFFAADYGGVGD